MKFTKLFVLGLLALVVGMGAGCDKLFPPQPVLVFTSPQASDEWRIGSAQVITWQVIQYAEDGPGSGSRYPDDTVFLYLDFGGERCCIGGGSLKDRSVKWQVGNLSMSACGKSVLPGSYTIVADIDRAGQTVRSASFRIVQ